MKKKTFLSLCLVLILTMSMTLTFFASGTVTTSLTADKQSVSYGEKVTITLAVPNHQTETNKFIGITGTLAYDATSFALVSSAAADGIEASNIDTNPLAGKILLLYFNNDAFTDENPVELQSGGKIISFTFEALKEKASADFTFTAEEIADMNGQVVDIIEGNKVSKGTVTVQIAKQGPVETKPTEPVPTDKGKTDGPGPKTGDSNHVALAVIAALSSFVLLFAAALKARGVSLKELAARTQKLFTRRTAKNLLILALVLSTVFQFGAMVKPDAKIVTQQFYTYGDANGDGVVDEADRALVRQAMVGKDVISSENFDAAKCYQADGKDKLALMDLVILQQRLSGIIYSVGESVYSQPSEVYYEVFVRAFYDSDGDGIGDFNGLAEKIPYLANLGITGIWMMPINKNGSSHGYDTQDYYEVCTDYGTMEDFNNLCDVAHAHGIDLVMDLVINHCSSAHSWFQEALKGPVLEDGSPNKYFDYFIFAPDQAELFVDKTALQIQNERSAYLAEHGSLDGWVEVYPKGDNATDNSAPINGYTNSTVWRTNSTLPGYRYTAIFGGMVDLNFNNPEVREEFINVANFWLENGIDGFRLDACRHIFGKYYSNIYSEEIATKNQEWWQEFRAGVEAVHPDAYLIGEIWEKNTENMVPFIEEGGLHSTFNFNLAGKLLAAAGNESTFYNSADYEEALTDPDSDDLNIATDLSAFYQRFGEASNGGFVDCTFLTNHDQNRVFSVLEGNMDHCRTAASMLLTLPGNPYIYYGEEVGLAGAKPDTNIREAMPWYIHPYDFKDDVDRRGNPIRVIDTDTVAPGMSTWVAQTKYSLGGEYSVEAQIDDESSLYSHYEELINARTNIPSLKDGGIGVFQVGDQRLVSYIRVTEAQRVLVIINLTGDTIEAPVGTSDIYGKFIRTVYTSAQDSVSGFDGKNVTLAPYSTIVIE